MSLERNALRTLLVSALAALLASCVGKTSADQVAMPSGREEPESMRARAALEELLKTDDYESIRTLPATWVKVLSPQARKQLIVLLLGGLRSDGRLGVTNYADMAVRSRVTAGLMPWHGHGEFIRQDVFTVGGRSAWAIEQLLHCELLEIAQGLDEKELGRRAEQCWHRVVLAMQLPE